MSSSIVSPPSIVWVWWVTESGSSPTTLFGSIFLSARPIMQISMGIRWTCMSLSLMRQSHNSSTSPMSPSKSSLLKITHLLWVSCKMHCSEFTSLPWEILSWPDRKWWIWWFGSTANKGKGKGIINCSLENFPCLQFSSHNPSGRENKSWVWSYLKRLQFKSGRARMAWGIEMTLQWLLERENCCREPYKSKWLVRVLEVWYTLFGWI
jgi:hypothetical protein